MEDQREFNAKLDNIRNDAIMETKNWWGGRFWGYRGNIITTNKELFSYQYDSSVPNEENKKFTYILKQKELNDDEYNKVVKFIDNEIIDKEFHNKIIYDAGFDVIVNYNGMKKVIKNNTGFEGNLQIYDKAKNLINELLKV